MVVRRCRAQSGIDDGYEDLEAYEALPSFLPADFGSFFVDLFVNSEDSEVWARNRGPSLKDIIH